MRELIGLTIERALEICKLKELKTVITENQSDTKYNYDTTIVTKAVIRDNIVHITTSLFALNIINS